MTDLWGFQAGQQQAQESQQSKALFQLSMAEGQQKLEETGMQIQAAKTALRLQSKMTEAMQAAAAKRAATSSTEQGPDTDLMPTMLEAGAKVAVDGGDIVRAEEMSSTASKLRFQQSEIDKAQNDVRKDDYQFIIDNAPNVTDEKTWNAFKMRSVAERGHPLAPQIAGMNYQQAKDSGMLDSMRDNSAAQLEKLKVSEAEARVKDVKAQSEERVLNEQLIKARTRETNLRADTHKKVGFEAADPKDITALSNRIQATYSGTKAATARDLALPLAEQVGKLRSQGRSQSEAVSQVFQDAQKSKTFDSLSIKTSKNAQQVDEAVGIIDKMIGILDTAKSDPTGISGRVNRVEEFVGNKFGSNKTDMADFEAGISQLQLMVPKIMTGSGQGAKYKQDMVMKMVRGTGWGSSIPNTRSSLMQLRDQLTEGGDTGGASGSWKPGDAPLSLDDYLKQQESK